jgi:thiamine-phosphate pyrophosphorylase
MSGHPHSLGQLELLCQQAAAHSVAVILRDRDWNLRQRFDAGKVIRDFTRQAEQYFLVADRLDLCAALDADGIHLGSCALKPSVVRPHVSWLSSAHHALDTLPSHELGALDAVLVSPAFAELKGNPALGEAGLRQRVAHLDHLTAGKRPRTFALGRVDDQNCQIALNAGCDGVASISSVLDPAVRRSLLARLGIERTHAMAALHLPSERSKSSR